jgi:hypothetical protein
VLEAASDPITAQDSMAYTLQISTSTQLKSLQDYTRPAKKKIAIWASENTVDRTGWNSFYENQRVAAVRMEKAGGFDEPTGAGMRRLNMAV